MGGYGISPYQLGSFCYGDEVQACHGVKQARPRIGAGSGFGDSLFKCSRTLT